MEEKIQQPHQPEQAMAIINRDEPAIVLKCLVMLSELMRLPDITKLNATLQTLLDEFISPSVGSLDFEIRSAAVKAMGCFCLRSIQASRQHLLLILQVRKCYSTLQVINNSDW